MCAVVGCKNWIKNKIKTSKTLPSHSDISDAVLQLDPYSRARRPVALSGRPVVPFQKKKVLEAYLDIISHPQPHFVDF